VCFPLESHLPRSKLPRSWRSRGEGRLRGAPHDIACFIAEPIQCEGGDRHLRAEFLLAVQDLCLRYDALFVVDEVQTGAGATGTPWCYQQLGLSPDLVAFARKSNSGRHGRPAGG